MSSPGLRRLARFMVEVMSIAVFVASFELGAILVVVGLETSGLDVGSKALLVGLAMLIIASIFRR